ncbi:MAG: hypothetical protein ACJAZM_000504 [Cyclobacteriaceae bacterium]|jgi:hypothetical protein
MDDNAKLANQMMLHSVILNFVCKSATLVV